MTNRANVRKFFVFSIFATFLLYNNYLFAAGDQNDTQLLRYRVFRLNNISAQQGKEYLAKAKIGTVSQLPNSNALLVTAQPKELIIAKTILELVDSRNTRFVITELPDANEVQKPVSNKDIAEKTGNISIGTFTDPPVAAASNKAIIDVCNDKVLVIAPELLTGQVLSAIKSLRESKAGQLAEKELKPQMASNGGQGNDFFDKLLNSLDKAEKTRGESALLPTMSDEPNAAGQIAEKRQRTQAAAPAAAQPPEQLPKQTQPESGPPKSAEGLMTPQLAEPNLIHRIYTYQPEPMEIGNQELTLNLPERLNIVDLLDLVGKYLQLDYMYDAAEVKAEVSLKVQGPIKVKDLYPLLESVLKFRGFVMTRKGNLVTIVPAGRVLEIDPVLLDAEKAGKIRYGDVIVTRMFKLNYIDTTSAKNLLDGMKLGTNITPIPETGTLIITEYAYRMSRIEELLAMIDKPGEPKQFRCRPLKYTMAKTLAPRIKSLVEQLGGIAITIAAKPAEEERPTARPAARPARTPVRTEPAAEPVTAKPTVFLDADERTNRILMIGLAKDLDVVDELVNSLDVAQQDLRALRLYEIQHVGADEVMKKLSELGIIGKTVEKKAAQPATAAARTTRAEARTPQTGEPAAAPTAAATVTEEGLVEEPQVVVIETTNSLLVNATPEQHSQIATIIGYVDSEPQQTSSNYVVYPLENQDPEKLAEVLNKFVNETVEKKDATGKIVETSTVKKTEEEISIIADKNTFSIIVYASKKNQQWIENIIRQLDKRRPQVLIDVTLVEITQNDDFTLDLQMVSKFPRLEPGKSMEKLTALLQPTTTGFPSNPVIESTVTSGSGTAFYSDEHIQALMTAMNKKGYGRIMARPKLLVNDSEKGTIRTEIKQTVVSPTTVIIPGTPSSSPTASATVSKETYTAEIKLDIKPNISEGDLLRLEITMTRTDFDPKPNYSLDTPGGKLTGPTPPDLLTSNVETIITVPNRRTIILGGLEKLNQSKGGTKVPILGDLPLVGGLFRSTSNKDTQDRLYLFVKANILRPGGKNLESDIVRISDKNRQDFERHESQMQNYEDWPGIKPTPMDPLRILESD